MGLLSVFSNKKVEATKTKILDMVESIGPNELFDAGVKKIVRAGFSDWTNSAKGKAKKEIYSLDLEVVCMIEFGDSDEFSSGSGRFKSIYLANDTDLKMTSLLNKFGARRDPVISFKPPAWDVVMTTASGKEDPRQRNVVMSFPLKND